MFMNDEDAPRAEAPQAQGTPVCDDDVLPVTGDVTSHCISRHFKNYVMYIMGKTNKIHLYAKGD